MSWQASPAPSSRASPGPSPLGMRQSASRLSDAVGKVQLVNSLRPRSERSDAKQDEKEQRASEQLEQSQLALAKHLESALQKLIECAPSAGEEEQWSNTVQGAFAALKREAQDVLSTLVEGLMESTRIQLKAQQEAFETKLTRSRTAAKEQLQNQAAEAQFSFQKQLEQKIAEVAAADTSELDEANEKLQEATKQLEGAKMKASGLQDALGQAQKQVRQGQEQEAALERNIAQIEAALTKEREDSAECKEMLDQALAELEVKTDDNKTLSERLQLLQDTFKKEKEELEKKLTERDKDAQEFKAMLDKALADLKVKTDDNQTLSERLQALIDEHQGLEEQVRESIDEMRGAKEEAGRQKEEADKQREEADRKAQALKAEEDENEKLREKLKTAHDADKQTQELRADLEKNETLREELKAALEDFKGQLEETMKERDEARSQRDEALASGGNSLEENARLEAECTRLQAELDRLQAELDELTSQRDNLSSQVEKLEAQSSGAAERINELEAEMSSVQQSLEAEVSRVRQSLEAEIEALKTSLSNTQRELDSKVNIIHEQELKLKAAAEAVTTIEKLKTELEERTSEVAALKGQNVDALAQKNALQEKVTNLSKELEAALNRNKDLDQQFEATRKELEEAKGHLRNLLEAGNGQDSQIKHWQDIAKKHADKVEQLELEISTCKATLKEALSTLALKAEENKKALALKEDENKSLSESLKRFIAEVDKLKQEVVDCQSMLKKALASLKVKEDSNKSLSEHLHRFVSEIDRSRERLADELEQRESAKTKSLMELITLLTDKSASIEKEKEECKSQILAALNPAAAAVPGTILQSDRAMSSLQTTLVDRFLATQYTLEQSERELTIMTELVTELRGKLEREMRESASREHDLQDSARAERDRIVRAAFNSLQLLRSHLAATLNGIRVRLPAGGIISEQKLDQMLAKVEAGHSPTGPSPNKLRRMKQQHSPKRSRPEPPLQPIPEPELGAVLPRLVNLNHIDPSILSPQTLRKRNHGSSGLHGSALSQALAASRSRAEAGSPTPAQTAQSVPLLRPRPQPPKDPSPHASPPFIR